MGILNFWRKPRQFFSPSESEKMVEAIRRAEQQTSGEVRVFIESRCRFVDPLDRAAEVFFGLKMEKTADRNGVLLYVAMKDQQLAVFGDEGIHKKVGDEFWKTQVQKILSHFDKSDYVHGISTIVTEIGNALHQHFPYNKLTDKNELPDEIVFGH